MDKTRGGDKGGGAGGGQGVLDSKTGKEVGRTPKDKDADGNVDDDDEVLAKEMAERLKAAEQKANQEGLAIDVQVSDVRELRLGRGQDPARVVAAAERRARRRQSDRGRTHGGD